MIKTARVASTVALAAAVGVLIVASGARAYTTSDRGAAILIYPKIQVDPANKVDTLIQISSTARGANPKRAYCFYINANSHCSNAPATVCKSSVDCGSSGSCVAGWTELDFQIVLTPEQPLAWLAGDGLQVPPLNGQGVCELPAGRPCFTAANCATNSQCITPGSNVGTNVPPVPEEPFIGALKCIEYTTTNPPVPDQSATTNTLIGNATILKGQTAPAVVLDAAKYAAVGLRALQVADATPSVLNLGGTSGAEYDGCANTLILDHLFDNATDPLSAGSATNGTVKTELTLVPCGDNFLTQTSGRATAQFLVFNEFEQRFSTSRTINCAYTSLISNIDTLNSSRSIFSAGVAGTIAGQTRIRGVGTAATGRGLVGAAVVNTMAGTVGGSAAYSLNQNGVSTVADIITLP